MALTKINDDIRTKQFYDDLNVIYLEQTIEQWVDDETGVVNNFIMQEKKYLNTILVQDKKWEIEDITELRQVVTPQGYSVPLDIDTFIQREEFIGQVRVLDYVRIYRKDTGTLLYEMRYDDDGVLRSGIAYDEEGQLIGNVAYAYTTGGLLKGSTSFYRDGVVYRFDNIRDGQIVNYNLYKYPDDDTLTANRVESYNVDEGTPILVTAHEFLFADRDTDLDVFDRINIFTAQLRANKTTINYLPDRRTVIQIIDLHSNWWVRGWEALKNSFYISTDDTKRIIDYKLYSNTNNGEILTLHIEGWNVKSSDIWENPENWFYNSLIWGSFNLLASDNKTDIFIRAMADAYNQDNIKNIPAIITTDDELSFYFDFQEPGDISSENWDAIARYIHDLNYIHPKVVKRYNINNLITSHEEFDLKGAYTRHEQWDYTDDTGDNYDHIVYNSANRIDYVEIYQNNVFTYLRTYNYNSAGNIYQIDVWEVSTRRHVQFIGISYSDDTTIERKMTYTKLFNPNTQALAGAEILIETPNNANDPDSGAIYTIGFDNNQSRVESIAYTDGQLVNYDITLTPSRIDTIETIINGTSVGYKEFEYNNNNLLIKVITYAFVGGNAVAQQEETFDSQGRLLSITDLINNTKETRDYYG